MVHHLYNLILTCFLLLYIPPLLLRSLFQKKFRKQLRERLAFYSGLCLKKPIWIHAASVGEVLCSVPLVKRIKKEFPHSRMILTTMTAAGRETAEKHLTEVDRVLFFPMDHPLILRRAIRNLSPHLLLIAETELWPNLLRLCGGEKIPILLFNGRISEKSFRRYSPLRFFFKDPLRSISLFLMQTEEDRGRIIRIGADPDRVLVAGNMKFDQAPPSIREEEGSEIKSLGLKGNETLLIAGSTHPGEEEILIRLFKELKKTHPMLHLLLAPRHLDRIEEVERVLRSENISWRRRTSLPVEEGNPVPEVIMLDTLGELMGFYRFGTLVFIGGSLVPVGGHNPLEPLFFKKCVLFGPHMFNFLEISRQLVEKGGAILVKDEEELAFELTRLLADEAECKERGEKGYQFIQGHRGATEKVMEEIRPFLL